MEILYENTVKISPKLSIILLDWSCRDSFHMLDYLNDQTVKRDQYEIIWIEYYNRRSAKIEGKVDKWILMDVPENVYYHKHLMYNIGLLASRGEIICICDSDAVVKPTFVENIIRSFDKDRNIVLHMDQVRNKSKRLYPFNYPSIEQILAEGCVNYKDGKTMGLLDTEDILHTRNYGACMCALRQDLINIGGADQHITYLGHICGPYELTFRLVNAGRKEVWHQHEFLYHTWHPGTDGHSNYLGPHDGKNMSTTALDVQTSGRILPLVENQAIKKLRSHKGHLNREALLSQAILGSDIKTWEISSIYWAYRKLVSYLKLIKSLLYELIEPLKTVCRLTVIETDIYARLLRLHIRQLCSKSTSTNKVMPKKGLFKIKLAFRFWLRSWKNDHFALDVSRQIIKGLKQDGTREIAIFGMNDLANILGLLAREERLIVKMLSDKELKKYNGKVLISSFVRLNDKVAKLIKLGVSKNNILTLE